MLLGTIVLLALAPAGPAPDSVGRGAQRHQCLAVEISSPREARPRARAGQRRPVFSASRSLDLVFRTRLRTHLDGTHTVEFWIRAPQGFPYQSLAVPVTPLPRAGAADRHSVRPTRRSRLDLTATLPVAGTAITSNSLYGRWTVEPLLDGTPCGPARSFGLKP